MKIENQVCTLEQAKRLKGLGIKYPSAFYWAYIEDNKKYLKERSGISWHPSLHLSPFERERWASGVGSLNAYNVAELGVMLPTLGITTLKSNNGRGSDFFSVNCHYAKERMNHHNEAFVKAAMLIYLLHKQSITAAEVNERLKNA